jgi:DNA-binding transcriptional ArsR family regulator
MTDPDIAGAEPAVDEPASRQYSVPYAGDTRAEPGSTLTTELARLDLLFRGLGDPTRIRILNVLAAGPLRVADLVRVLVLPQPFVSRHLAYLRRCGLVRCHRESKFAYYYLAEPMSAPHRGLIACLDSLAEIPPLAAERSAAAQAAALSPSPPSAERAERSEGPSRAPSAARATRSAQPSAARATRSAQPRAARAALAARAAVDDATGAAS